MKNKSNKELLDYISEELLTVGIGSEFTFLRDGNVIVATFSLEDTRNYRKGDTIAKAVGTTPEEALSYIFEISIDRIRLFEGNEEGRGWMQ